MSELLKHYEEVVGKGSTELPGGQTVHNSDLKDFRNKPAAAKRAHAYQLRLQGKTVRWIAALYDVDAGTVYKWLKQCTEEYLSSFETNSGAEVVADNLAFLDELEAICLAEISAAGKEPEFDTKTGTFKTKTSPDASKEKNTWVQTLLKVRDSKIKIQAQVGIMPSEADGLYRKVDENKVDKIAEIAKANERTEEELKKDVEDLFKGLETL